MINLQSWCSETCQCECKEETIPKYCGPNKIWNNATCQCDCIYERFDCDLDNPLYEFNYDTCRCDCPSYQSDPGTCTTLNPKQFWDKSVCRCDCIDDSERLTCTGNDPLRKWSITECGCTCRKILNCDPILFSGFNATSCECDCIADQPPLGCPSGFSWDRNICDCKQCIHCVNPNAP